MKKSLLMVAAIILIAAGCNKVADNNSLSAQYNCSQDANKSLDRFQKDNPNFQDLRQENHYNQKLNKCLVMFTYYYDYHFTRSIDKVVLDALENKKIITCEYNFDEPQNQEEWINSGFIENAKASYCNEFDNNNQNLLTKQGENLQKQYMTQ